MAAADRLGLGSQVRELKIGKSFGRGARANFHTIRYDFKPASVDHRQKGSLSVAEDGKAVSVTVPNQDVNQPTNYGGHLKEANKKDCILIIDTETGEITLERLSSQMLVKKLRAEKPEKVEKASSSNSEKASSSSFNGMPSRPITPLDQVLKRSAKSSPAASNMSSPGSYHHLSLPSSSRHGSRSSSPNTSLLLQQHTSSSDGFSGISVNDMLPDFTSMAASSSAGSSSINASGSVGFGSNQMGSGVAKGASISAGLELSDSSSSDENSSSDSDDSDISTPDPPKSRHVTTASATAALPQQLPFAKNQGPSMPSDLLLPSMGSPKRSSIQQQQQQVASSSYKSQVLSMPQVLNDDLQLSDEDSSDMDEL